jgi:tetratricopeptide (TPR) repeat protein
MRDESTDVREKAYRQATALIPPGFKGQISWGEVDNRSFLRIAHGYLLGLMHRGDGKAAKALAKKLLTWCPADNLGVRMLLGDISLMTGDTQSAMKSYLKEAADSPAHWYQAGQIAFRDGDFVSACTYVRRGIAANPYIAEGLTGRTKINEHLYWHASNRNGPDWATDYLRAPVCNWSAQEIDFVDWVFNSSAVLRERASLMDQHEGLTYERDAVRREPFALRSSYFVNELTDDLSTAMVKRIQNRYGVEIWPWERADLFKTVVT